MSCRVGLVSQRSQVWSQVWAVVAELGGEVLADVGEPAAVMPATSGSVGGLVQPPRGRAGDVVGLLVDARADPAAVPMVGAELGTAVRVVVGLEGERSSALRQAAAVGADHVVELPGGAPWLRQWLSRGAVGPLRSSESGSSAKESPELGFSVGSSGLSGPSAEPLPMAGSWRGAAPGSGSRVGPVPESCFSASLARGPESPVASPSVSVPTVPPRQVASAPTVAALHVGGQGYDVPPGGVPLIGVLGAVGGVGATAVAIAVAAARATLLVDLDPDGAGIDLPLGLDSVAGIRWEGLPVSARGPLDQESFLAALPRAGGSPVLCGAVPDVEPGPVGSVLATARAHPAGAVLDLGRRDRHGALAVGDWLVVVTSATVPGVVAARRVLEARSSRVIVTVREEGWLPRSEVLAELGDPWVVWMPRLRRARELAECGQLLAGATGRALLRVGHQISERAA